MIKILKCGEVSNDEIFSRGQASVNVEAIVSDIIANVRANGDKAIFEYNKKFDKADLTELQVSDAEIQEAIDIVGSDFIRVIKRAAANIQKFHKKQI